jgi:hypothetical protein
MRFPAVRPSEPIRPPEQARRRQVLIAAAALVLLLAGLTARLFVWPPAGDAGPGRRDPHAEQPWRPLPVALQLAREHRARYLVVSQGTVASHYPARRRLGSS